MTVYNIHEERTISSIFNLMLSITYPIYHVRIAYNTHMGKELIMTKFTLVAVKGTDVNVNIEAEMTPAEVAQVLVTSRDSLKDLIGLLHEAKSTAKEFYEEFKPIMQRRAAAALDRDGSSWVREEEMSRIKHEIEMEKLRQELAELKTKSADKDNDAVIERIRTEALAEGREAERAERYSRNTITGTDAKPTENSNGVRVVSLGNSEIHSRRIAETTATTRDRD